MTLDFSTFRDELDFDLLRALHSNNKPACETVWGLQKALKGPET